MIESAVAVMIAENVASDSAPSSSPERASTNENSPAGTNAAAVSTAVCGRAIGRNSNRAATGFSATISTSVMSSNGHSSAITSGSMSMPTDTKKSTANTSRVGNSSPSTRCDRSDSDTTNPARNAPSASESPMYSDASAVLNASAAIARKNSSRDRSSATRASANGITCSPMTNTPIRNAATFSAASENSRVIAPAPLSPDTASSATISTTAHRSCTIDHVTVSRPWSDAISPRASSSFTATTLLAIAAAAPTYSDWSKSHPASVPQTTPPTMTTHDLRRCRGDSPRTGARQLPQRELHADAEQQQHDADVRDQSQTFGVTLEPRCEGRDHQPRDDVADNR